MSDKLKRVGGALTGLATGATFYSLYITIQDQSMKGLLLSLREENEALGKTIVKLSADNSLSELKRAEFLKHAEAKLDRFQQILDKVNEGQNATATWMMRKENVDWTKEADENLSELRKLVYDLKGSDSGSGTGSSSQFVDHFNTNLVEELQQLANSYWDWVHNLSIMQQFAISHILAAITILFSLSSLITIFYSDYLIKHFNLESKFPRLAKYLSLRRTFQQYYFFLNTAVIIFFLGLVILFNLYLFSIS